LFLSLNPDHLSDFSSFQIRKSGAYEPVTTEGCCPLKSVKKNPSERFAICKAKWRV